MDFFSLCIRVSVEVFIQCKYLCIIIICVYVWLYSIKHPHTNTSHYIPRWNIVIIWRSFFFFFYKMFLLSLIFLFEFSLRRSLPMILQILVSILWTSFNLEQISFLNRVSLPAIRTVGAWRHWYCFYWSLRRKNYVFSLMDKRNAFSILLTQFIQ